MSAVREAVEWDYKEIKLYITSQDMKRKLNCTEAPIALMYIFAAVLGSFKTCLGHKRIIGVVVLLQGTISGGVF